MKISCRPSLGRPLAEDRHDVRVRGPGQVAVLGRRAVGHLDDDQAVFQLGILGEEDPGEAAAAQLPDQPVGADLVAGPGRERRVERLVAERGRQGVVQGDQAEQPLPVVGESADECRRSRAADPEEAAGSIRDRSAPAGASGSLGREPVRGSPRRWAIAPCPAGRELLETSSRPRRPRRMPRARRPSPRRGDRRRGRPERAGRGNPARCPGAPLRRADRGRASGHRRSSIRLPGLVDEPADGPLVDADPLGDLLEGQALLPQSDRLGLAAVRPASNCSSRSCPWRFWLGLGSARGPRGAPRGRPGGRRAAPRGGGRTSGSASAGGTPRGPCSRRLR